MEKSAIEMQNNVVFLMFLLAVLYISFYLASKIKLLLAFTLTLFVFIKGTIKNTFIGEVFIKWRQFEVNLFKDEFQVWIL